MFLLYHTYRVGGPPNVEGLGLELWLKVEGLRFRLGFRMF